MWGGKGEKQAEQRMHLGLGPQKSRLSVSLPHQSCSINVSGVAWAQARDQLWKGRNCLVQETQERMQSFQKAVNKSSALAWCPEVSQLSSQLEYQEWANVGRAPHPPLCIRN